MENFRNESNPWLGLKTYEEGQILYGRTEEINTLSQNILFNVQTVIYGKSGIGKSSILNAGVFPILRRSNFFPVNIRLVHNQPEKSYNAQIWECVIDSLNHLRKERLAPDGTKEVIKDIKGRHEELATASEDESLWEMFHRNVFYDDAGERIQPVLVFDQFEEIFTREKDANKITEFFNELADLINNVVPAYLCNNVTKEQERANSDLETNEDLLLEEDFDAAFADYLMESNFHIVLSLREDFLSYLERNIANIPLLKHNRYCLKPLNEEQAASIIMDPAPDLVNIDVAKEIISKVTGVGTDKFGLGDEPELEVDSAILSLFLSELYERIPVGSKTIDKSLVVELGDNIIQGFYERTISKISADCAEYLEYKLITEDGRRDSVFESHVIKHKGYKVSDLEYLKKQRLIREFPWNNGIRIEFIHDVLCPIIVQRKEERKLAEKRLEEEKKNRKRLLNFTATTVLLLLFIIIPLILHNNSLKKSNDLFVEQKNIILNSRLKLMHNKIKQLIDENDSYTARRLCLELQFIKQPIDVNEIPGYFNNILRRLSNNNNAIFKGHENAIIDVAFNHKGSQVASVSDTTIIIWDTNNGKQIRTIKGSGENILSISFSLDGRNLAAGSDDGSIHIYDTNTGSCHAHMKDSLGIRFVTFTPDGKMLVSASKNKSVCMWNACTGELIRRFPDLHQNEILYLSFSNDLTRMASASADRKIKIWDVDLAEKKLDLICTLGTHNDWVRSVDFNPANNKQLVSASDDGTLKLWNIDDKSHTLIHKTNCYITRALFSPDGKYIVASYRNGYVKVWDTETGIENMHFQGVNDNYVNAVAISNDAKRIVSAGSDMFVRKWDLKSNLDIEKYPIDTVKILNIELKGNILSVCHDNNVVSCYDINNMQNGAIWKKDDKGKFQRSIINSEKKIVAFIGYKTIVIRDLLKGDEIKRIDNAHRGWIYALTQSPDGKYLATGGYDKCIKIWDWDLNLKFVLKECHSDDITSLNYNHNGDKIVSASKDKSAKIWQICEKNDSIVIEKEPYIVGEHSGRILHACFSKNDSLLLTSSSDKTARIWNLQTKDYKTFSGLSGFVNQAAFGLDGKEIITISSDKMVRIWDVDTQQLLLTLHGHSKSISSLACNEKESYFITASWDGTIKLWKNPSIQDIVYDITARFGELTLTDEELNTLDGTFLMYRQQRISENIEE